jgi:DNA-binding SARP family transcriptional activator/WD40 repeat protein
MRIMALGPVEVEHDGVVVNVGGRQQRRLLALLVAHRGRPVSAERLVDAMWPDGDAPDGSLRSMRTYLSRLRAVLPDDSIVTRHGGYQLGDGAMVDIDAFERLVEDAERSVPDEALDSYSEAIELWRGDPFGEFTDEWWALGESKRLIELRELAEEGRAATLMALGHHNRAIPELERLIAEHPLRERPVRLMMQSLHVAGRPAEALRAGRAFRARLGDKTGLEPSSELTALESTIVTDTEPAAGSIGRPLRGYTLHRAIGEGSYGRVYEATQPGTDRPVAIKVIRPDFADSSEFIRRFDAEARLIARLEHPHIVPLYDYWREPGGAYLVFRLLTGGTAHESVVVGGPWSFERVSRLVEEIGAALIAAHAAGVVHRDVKSSNVLLDEHGASYLTDFGIAVSGREPPCGDDDVRGLATLAWELLTGTHPPPTPTGVLPTLIGRVASVPDGIDAVLGRASGTSWSVAELILGWRAATGRPDGALSPVTSSERHAADSARQRAVVALTRSTIAGVNPYRGLRSFDEGDAAQFFGRAAVVDDLFERVGTSRLVTVIGASGSGKSSVVRAGLVPRLRADGCVAVAMVPGDDPLTALDAALAEVATAADFAVGANLADGIGNIARRCGKLVIVVDQFEECWTRTSSDQRAAFIEVMTRTMVDSSADVAFIATLRADLTDRPLEDPTLGPLMSAAAYVLAAPSPTDLREAIVQPSLAVGVGFDDGVVADLIAEAVSQPGSLPLLQFTLTALYDRRVDGVIGRDALEAVGGMAGSIGHRAEQLFSDLDETDRGAVRELFARLVVPGIPDTRRRARRSELTPAMSSVADRFVDARLLTSDQDPSTREPMVEVAHEALLIRWERLAEWITADRYWLDQLDHLAAAARSWDNDRTSDSELYRGVRLEAALEAIETDGRAVSPVEREFVEAGRAARDAEVVTARRTARRLRRRLAGVAAMLVVVLVAGVVAIVQRGDARDAAERAQAARAEAIDAEARARAAADESAAAEALAVTASAASAASEQSASIEALVGRADSLRSSQRDLAALLAAEAYRIADTPRTRSTLFGMFTDGQGFLDAHRLPGERGTTGIVLADGTSAYLTAQDGRIHSYDLDDGTLGSPLPTVGNGDRFPVLAGSPDSTLLAVAAKDDPRFGPTTVTVFDVDSASPRFSPVVIDEPVTSMAFLPGGRLGLATGENGGLLVIDDATGAVTGELPGLDVEPDRIIWTSDLLLRRPSAVAVSGADLFVSAADGRLRVLDVDTLAVLRTLAFGEQTLSNLWPLDDGTLITSGRFGQARVDPANGDVLWAKAERDDRCTDLTVVEQRNLFYCGDGAGRLEERDLTTNAVLRQLDVQGGSTESLWIAAEGTELVAFGRNEPVVSRWRLDGSGPITDVVAPGWTPYAFNHTGQLLLFENDDLEAIVVDVADPSMVEVVNGLVAPSWMDEDSLIGAAFNAAGSLEVATFDLGSDRARLSGGDAIDPIPTANDLDTGKQRMVLRFGDRIDASVAAFDTETMRRSEPIPIDGYVSHAITRVGDRIAVGTERGVEIYDSDSGELVDSRRVDDLRQVFITVTDQLFVGSLGGELTHYDLDTLQPIRSFGGSRGQVFHLHGTADGSTIAFSGSDRRAAVYDVASGVQLGGTIAIAADERNAVRLSLDGRWLAVGGQPTLSNEGLGRADVGEKTAQIWDLDPNAWAAAACRVAGRNLTQAEWSEHIGDLAPYRQTCPST